MFRVFVVIVVEGGVDSEDSSASQPETSDLGVDSTHQTHPLSASSATQGQQVQTWSSQAKKH